MCLPVIHSLEYVLTTKYCWTNISFPWENVSKTSWHNVMDPHNKSHRKIVYDRRIFRHHLGAHSTSERGCSSRFLSQGDFMPVRLLYLLFLVLPYSRITNKTNFKAVKENVKKSVTFLKLFPSTASFIGCCLLGEIDLILWMKEIFVMFSDRYLRLYRRRFKVDINYIFFLNFLSLNEIISSV